MPQLMPLKWIFSSWMILLMILMTSLVYSMLNEGLDFKKEMSEMKKFQNKWLW